MNLRYLRLYLACYADAEENWSFVGCHERRVQKVVRSVSSDCDFHSACVVYEVCVASVAKKKINKLADKLALGSKILIT